MPIAVAVAAALGVGLAGGALNATLISRLSLPPLIVTLGTFSMFRGIAEGMTQAAVNYSGFPPRFLALGQGYFGGVDPGAVARSFSIVLIGYAILLHRRSSDGRSTRSASTRRAQDMPGIPVRRRVALVYVLSGLIASLAAIVYIARLGQARSDAGIGYELEAITVVVLGGTSVFGGRGTIWGTVLGLFALAVLKNGLHLAALPSEMTGVLTGIPAGWHDRDRSPPACRAACGAATRGGRDSREKQSGRGAVQRGSPRVVHRGWHQRVARSFAGDEESRSRGQRAGRRRHPDGW